jgi:hypothetical protein
MGNLNHPHIGQAGLELLGSTNPPVLAFQVVGTMLARAHFISAT